MGISDCFEIKHRDLLGRIGTIHAKSGSFETPAFLPVINPRNQQIPAKQMTEDFGFHAVITNAYLLHKWFREEAISNGVHGFLDFPGVAMTDSGAYQILRYGHVEVDVDEILEFQEKIGSDIAVILDVPTGGDESRSHAEVTVRETLARAQRAFKKPRKKDVLLVGPIQGGIHLDLLAKSARKISELPFHISALGSPTEIMEQYRFDVLVDMIMTAKVNLPPERPLHLFGAGHPFLFPFAVALGCDLFDSAAYALFARNDRYMTENGTIRLEELEYLPCSCSVCTTNSAADLREKWRQEREILLARHNLHICKQELERTKQSIREGRLWELLEARARAHPSLLKALKRIGQHSVLLEKNSPLTKSRGILLFGQTSSHRPEVTRHKKRVVESYKKPSSKTVLVLLPAPTSKPFHSSREFSEISEKISKTGENTREIHFCFYHHRFGIIPSEIDDVFPLSQFEDASTDSENSIMEEIQDFLAKNNYKKVIIVRSENLRQRLPSRINGTRIDVIGNAALPYSVKSVERLIAALGG